MAYLTGLTWADEPVVAILTLNLVIDNQRHVLIQIGYFWGSTIMHKYIIVALLSIAFFPEWPAHALAKGQEMVSTAKTALDVSAITLGQ